MYALKYIYVKLNYLFIMKKINMKHWVLRQLNEGLFYPLYDYCRHEKVTAEEQDAIVEWLREKMAANTGENFTEAKSCISALELNPNIELTEGVYLYLAEYAPQEIFCVDTKHSPEVEAKAFQSMLFMKEARDYLLSYAGNYGLSKGTESHLLSEYAKIEKSDEKDEKLRLVYIISILQIAAERPHTSERQLGKESLKLLLTGPIKIKPLNLYVWDKDAIPWLLARYTPEEMAEYLRRSLKNFDLEKINIMQLVELFKTYTELPATENCSAMLAGLLIYLSHTRKNTMALIDKYPQLYVHMLKLPQVEVTSSDTVKYFVETAGRKNPKLKEDLRQAIVERPYAFDEDVFEYIFKVYSQDEIINLLNQCEKDGHKLRFSKEVKRQYPYIKKYVD